MLSVQHCIAGKNAVAGVKAVAAFVQFIQLLTLQAAFDDCLTVILLPHRITLTPSF